LEADPSEEFVLRSPFTGILESEGAWPAIGIHIAEGTNIGSVQPLFTPMDQIGLSERLASTRAEFEAANASTASASKEVSRLKQLNAEDQNISDRALQQAEAQLAAEQAKLKSAQASVDLITATLQPRLNLRIGALQVRKAGQVTEVTAQPGESVQAGQALLRISQFDHLLARLYVPPGQSIPASVNRAMVYSADQAETALPAYRVALAGSIDPRYQGQTWLFRLAPGKVALRPGEAVTAHVPIPGPAAAGVLIPSSAILRFEGETWVYIEQRSGEFVRRMAALDQHGKDGWVVKSGFAPGERVVVSGAQTLLSEEMKSQLESDEE
jgi:multidrug efflux system membrane fusion protein